MGQNDPNLERLISFLDELIDQPGNEWMVEKIIDLAAKRLPPGQASSHPLIKKIYEQCIEEIIKSQANDFYSGFPVNELKEELIKDYINMEHMRRRNDFERFGLSMFQQVELISNYFFKQLDFKDRIKNERLLPAYLTKVEGKNVKNIRGDTVDRVILRLSKDADKAEINKFFGDDGYPVIAETYGKRKWNMMQIFRAVLYFKCFNSNVFPNTMINIFKTGEFLYQVRNRVHREGVKIGKNEKFIEDIQKNSSRYYFKLYGFLEEFVTKICENHKSSIVT